MAASARMARVVGNHQLEAVSARYFGSATAAGPSHHDVPECLTRWYQHRYL